MNVSKAQATAVATEIQAAIAEVLAKHNMTPEVKWGYGDFFKFTVTATPKVEGPNGVDLGTQEAQYFQKFGWTAYGEAPHFTMKQLTAPLGTQVMVNGEMMAFAGIAAKRKKYPIVMLTEAGETVFLTETIIDKLNAAGVNA